MKYLFWRKILLLWGIEADIDKYVLGNYKNPFIQ